MYFDKPFTRVTEKIFIDVILRRYIEIPAQSGQMFQELFENL